MQPAGHRIRGLPQRNEIVRLDQPQTFVGREPLTFDGLFK